MREPASPQSLLPHNKEAEQGVLGAIIHNNDALNETVDVIEPDYFFSPAHREIYKAMLELYERKDPIDEITLGHLLRSRNLLEQVGDLVYIAELVDLTPVMSNVEVYAKIVRENYQLRSMINAANEIATRGKEKPENVEILLEQAEGIFIELSNQAHKPTYSSIKDLLLENFARLEAAQDRGDDLTGLPSGFTELDSTTSGMQPSDLIIIAARPGMGKTSFAANIAKYAASQSKKAVVFFSLEMSKEQMAMRLLCSDAGVEHQKVRRGSLDDFEWDKLANSAGALSELKLIIDETPELTPLALKAKARRIAAEEDLGLIIVDYLQLMRSSNRKDNREQEIAEISRSLKGIAKEFNVPVVALSQLNRSLESRSEKRPMLADLRESGSIEQDADIVMFIYRDDVYNKDSEDQGIAEIHIAKHRNGPLTGKDGIRLAFIAQYTKFANLSLRTEEDGTYN